MRNQIKNYGQITLVAANMIWSVGESSRVSIEYRYVVTCNWIENYVIIAIYISITFIYLKW